MTFNRRLFDAALKISRHYSNRSIFWRRVAMKIHTGKPWADVVREDEHVDSLLSPPFHVAPDVPRRGSR